MGAVKSYRIVKTFRSATNRSLVKNLPSDLLYTFGAGLYDKSERSNSHIQREFYRKALDKVVQLAANLKAMESKYHG